MNAIITAATGYTEGDLEIFLWSVARHCKNTIVFLISYYRDRKFIEQLRNKYVFIKPVYIRASTRQGISKGSNSLLFPYCSWIACQLSKREYLSVVDPLKCLGNFALSIAQERFFIALKLVKRYRDLLSNILLTDCRDVVIQSDPFSIINGKCISGIEPAVIGNEQYNTNWIKALYGDDILNEMSGSFIVCAGVTLGPAKEIENYLSEICSEMWKYLPKIIFSKIAFGSDQSIHNYLIFKKRIVLDLVDNQQGLIATLNYENPSNFIKNPTSKMVKVHDKYPSIIHQYDRHSDLLDFFKQSVSPS